MAEGAAQPPASRLTPEMAVGCQVTLTTILDEVGSRSPKTVSFTSTCN